MWNKIKVFLLVVGGVALAILTFGALKDNRLLEKANELKEKSSKDYHETKTEEKMKQKRRREEAKESNSKKEELDNRLDKLKNGIKNSGTKMFILALILVISFSAVGYAQDEELPSNYKQMKELYLKTARQLATVKEQRDEAISIAEGYKAEYERIDGLRKNAEKSVDTLETQIDDMYDTIKEQNNIILELAGSNGVEVSGGVLYDPGSDGSDAKPFAAVSLEF